MKKKTTCFVILLSKNDINFVGLCRLYLQKIDLKLNNDMKRFITDKFL